MKSYLSKASSASIALMREYQAGVSPPVPLSGQAWICHGTMQHLGPLVGHAISLRTKVSGLESSSRRSVVDSSGKKTCFVTLISSLIP